MLANISSFEKDSFIIIYHKDKKIHIIKIYQVSRKIHTTQYIIIKRFNLFNISSERKDSTHLIYQIV